MLGKFQIGEFKGWKGLTKDNHLYALENRENVGLTSALIMRIRDYNYGASLESYLSRFPVKYYEDDSEIKWKLVASGRRNIPIVEVRDINGNPIIDGFVGANGEPFYVVFPEDYFADGNVIVGEKNEMYPILLKADPIVEGSLYVFMAETMGGLTSGIPAEEFEYGKRFSDDFSPVERELSRKVGDVRFGTTTEMRNEFSAIRLQHKVAGNKLDKKMKVGIPLVNDRTGKTTVSEYWMHHEDWAVESQFSYDKNYCIAYATSNRTASGEYLNFGKSGNIIKMGAGIRQQMSYGYTQYFNKFTITLLENILFNLDESLTGEAKKKTIVLDTGKRGALKFHKAIMAEASGWQITSLVQNNAGVINKVASELHDNALSAGFQFVEYKAPMGITVKININPMKDDPIRNKIMHPEGGVAESYSYDVYSLGTAQEPNIQIAKVKGEEDYRGFQAGFRNPFTGEKNIQNMSYDEDSAVIHRYSVLGSIVYNPNDCIRLIPSVLA